MLRSSNTQSLAPKVLAQPISQTLIPESHPCTITHTHLNVFHLVGYHHASTHLKVFQSTWVCIPFGMDQVFVLTVFFWGLEKTIEMLPDQWLDVVPRMSLGDLNQLLWSTSTHTVNHISTDLEQRLGRLPNRIISSKFKSYLTSLSLTKIAPLQKALGILSFQLNRRSTSAHLSRTSTILPTLGSGHE